MVTYIRSDLDFILQQILIAEHHGVLVDTSNDGIIACVVEDALEHGGGPVPIDDLVEVGFQALGLSLSEVAEATFSDFSSCVVPASRDPGRGVDHMPSDSNSG